MTPSTLPRRALVGACRLAALSLLALPVRAADPYPGWGHSGKVYVITTPEGAALPAGTVLKDFPTLIRLHRDSFPFAEALPGGADVRFSDAAGNRLAHQIEQWDAAAGEASVWVRVPEIRGEDRQPLTVHWGKADAAPESDGAAVFNAANGYLSVWHMDDPVRDTVGTLESKDVGTTPTPGLIGPARHLAGRQGIAGGETILNYPMGHTNHSSEAWFRAEKANGMILGWGKEKGQGKVTMQFASPPHIRMDCYFSGANVEGGSALRAGDWTHVVHTHRPGESRVYINGVLDGESTTKGSPLNIERPARLWLGGWYNNYSFVGDLDEVRISSVARGPEWIRLQHENTKPLQSLVGPVVRPGRAFSVSPREAELSEGGSATFTAIVDGAWKVTWSRVEDDRETVVAVDRQSLAFAAGRVSGPTTRILRVKALYPDGVQTQDIRITVRETIPDPEFTLQAPARWDGRTPLMVRPVLSNAAALQTTGAGPLRPVWDASTFAVTQEVHPDHLLLTRTQQSGELTVSATLDNGGQPVRRSVRIAVTEPATDPWVSRTPGEDEKPEEGQFYAREDGGDGVLHCNGKLEAPAEEVFLRLFADGAVVKTETARPAADGRYRLSTRLKPGLISYRVEFGTKSGGVESVTERVGDLVCGDAYIIDGQSNALATDTGEKSPPETNTWIRSYGRPSGNPKDNEGNLWCKPVWKAQKGERAELGWWGMELAKNLVRDQRMPIFIINAAVGGTRIDQHQRDVANPVNLDTIYGRMLWRARGAKLTHGIRAILWHQGENDQGSDGPTGGYGWQTYQAYFMDMAAGWKQDFPNVRNYYAFQIWPNSCSMGGNKGNGDRLREKQRTLPRLFSQLHMLSTLGVRPPGGCHFPLVGWAEFAHMAQPLIARDFYGRIADAPLTPPNLVRATAGGADTVTLEFDQPVAWEDRLLSQFYLDGEKSKFTAGQAEGNRLILRRAEPGAARHITYLKEASWNQDTLLLGKNGLAALTFCEVPLVEEPKAKGAE